MLMFRAYMFQGWRISLARKLRRVRFSLGPRIKEFSNLLLILFII
nr:MAG TPA: Toll-like receptor 3 trans-membrane domain [Crassvirales sp.]